MSKQESHEEKMAMAAARAMKELFSIDDGHGRKRFIDITRVPLICQSIVGIDSRLKAIESNITWGVRVVIGAILLGVVALIIKQ